MNNDDAQRVMDAVDRESILGLAQELIRIPSFKTEETQVARYIAEFLNQRGYEVQLQEVEPGRFQTIATLKGGDEYDQALIIVGLRESHVRSPINLKRDIEEAKCSTISWFL